MYTTLAISAALMVAGLVAGLVLYWKMKKLLKDTENKIDRTATEIEKQISNHSERRQ